MWKVNQESSGSDPGCTSWQRFQCNAENPIWHDHKLYMYTSEYFKPRWRTLSAVYLWCSSCIRSHCAKESAHTHTHAHKNVDYICSCVLSDVNTYQCLAFYLIFQKWETLHVQEFFFKKASVWSLLLRCTQGDLRNIPHTMILPANREFLLQNQSQYQHQPVWGSIGHPDCWNIQRRTKGSCRKKKIINNGTRWYAYCISGATSFQFLGELLQTHTVDSLPSICVLQQCKFQIASE